MFAIIDLETTGGNAVHDKITEIAIYLHNGKEVVDHFVSLINPECSIPPFISRLTGIDNDMVSTAPKFYEVAKDIVEFTDGATIVAHNATFDYSFLCQEYKSLGFTYSRDYLCTVRMSRKLIPGFRSYSLGNLCQQLGIQIENRHRAAGDALATVKLFELLMSKESFQEQIQVQTKNDYLHLRFPAGFDKKLVEGLPENPGVYYLYNEDGSIIYIGKSNNIRKRVLTHFSNKETRKSLAMRNAIRDVSFEETGSELIALLLESAEIKAKQPVFNRAQKNSYFNYGVYLNLDERGYYCLHTKRIKGSEQPLSTYKTQEEAVNTLERMAAKYGLCRKLCGMYAISHACFHYSIHQCKGACIGKESTDEYNSRVQDALKSLEYHHQNFIIIGTGRAVHEKSLVLVERGKYIGFGFFDPDCTGNSIEELKEMIQPREDNRDVQRILRSHLQKNRQDKIITFESQETL